MSIHPTTKETRCCMHGTSISDAQADLEEQRTGKEARFTPPVTQPTSHKIGRLVEIRRWRTIRKPWSYVPAYRGNTGTGGTMGAG